MLPIKTTQAQTQVASSRKNLEAIENYLVADEEERAGIELSPKQEELLAEFGVSPPAIREAFRSTRPAEKPHAHAKHWQDLLGQTGGAVRRRAGALCSRAGCALRSGNAGSPGFRSAP